MSNHQHPHPPSPPTPQPHPHSPPPQKKPALILRDATGVQRRVSPQELKFANDYYMALGGLLQEQVLASLPPNYNSLVRLWGGGGAARLGCV
jgi:hypothetical protein